MATKQGQMPSGTHRRGVGDRPFSSYVIFRLDGENKEVQLGLTHRVDLDGKPRWQGDTGKDKSPLLLVHREAVEWILSSQPSAAQPAPKPDEAKQEPDLTEKLRESVAAVKENPKDDSEAAPGEPAPTPPAVEPKPAARARKAKAA